MYIGMKKIFLVILIILIAVSIVFFGENKRGKIAFNRNISSLEYSAHAKCRMNCRNISAAEVQEILKEGTINRRKTNTSSKPCPSYALEGRTADDQRVRIVFAQCGQDTKVVTVIDLGMNWECDCPGDKRKSKKQDR